VQVPLDRGQGDVDDGEVSQVLSVTCWICPGQTPFVNANVNGGCVSYARRREGRSRSRAVRESPRFRSRRVVSSPARARARACTRWGTHADGTRQ
jgi:hypothetical protein